MQFHHNGYVSGDPRIQPAAGTGHPGTSCDTPTGLHSLFARSQSFQNSERLRSDVLYVRIDEILVGGAKPAFFNELRPFAPDVDVRPPEEITPQSPRGSYSYKLMNLEPYLRKGHRQKYALSVAGGGQTLQYFIRGLVYATKGTKSTRKGCWVILLCP